MPLIEGIGDEVTLIISCFVMGLVLLFAWFSTHTSEIPLIREVGVIVVEMSQHRSRTAIQGQDSEEGTESQLTGQQSQDVSVAEAGSNGNEEDVVASVEDNSSHTVGASNIPRDDNMSTSSSAVSIEQQSKEPLAPGTVTTGSGSAAASEDISTENCRSRKLSNTSEALVPEASVIVSADEGTVYAVPSDLPSEEEVRKRRVQYFESSQKEDIATTPQNSESSATASASCILKNSDPDHLRTNLKQSPGSEKSDDADGVNQTVSSVVSDAEGGRLGLPEESTTVINDSYQSSDIDSADVSERIRVKLKYMNETQRLVYASPEDTIGDFRRTHFQHELEDNKWVRFIYNGQDLRDDARTLQACNVGDNCTVHCLVTSQTRTSPSLDVTHEEEDDSFMGSMMYPLFAVILLVVWYFRFTYRQYFSAMSTVCLIGISFLLALSYISSLRTSEHPPQQAATGGRTQDRNHPHSE